MTKFHPYWLEEQKVKQNRFFKTQKAALISLSLTPAAEAVRSWTQCIIQCTSYHWVEWLLCAACCQPYWYVLFYFCWLHVDFISFL